MGDAKARTDEELTRVRDALTASEEARRKAEAEAACLEVEKTSLLLDIRATKDEVSSLKSQAGKDKEAMEEVYHKALELVFFYGYECCVFKHNICGDQPEVLDGMLDSFDPLPLELFMNPRCPLARAPTKAIGTEVEHNKTIEMTKELERRANIEDFVGTS